MCHDTCLFLHIDKMPQKQKCSLKRLENSQKGRAAWLSGGKKRRMEENKENIPVCCITVTPYIMKTKQGYSAVRQALNPI
jgi:hypothetical protein